MKKAKLMLLGLAAFTVVGGVLAFKAKNVQSDQLFYWNNAAQSVCTPIPFATTEVGTPLTNPSDFQLGYYTQSNCQSDIVTGYVSAE